MSIYYIVSNPIYKEKYNFFNLIKSVKTINDIQKEIYSIPNFCRDQQSITTSELKGYLVSGISFFTENSRQEITGLANFDINQDRINIIGICIPIANKGNGTLIINEIKQFGRLNNMKEIKLTCYGDVKNFYQKLGFVVTDQILLYNSDDEDSDNSEDDIGDKIRYEMLYKVKENIGGRKSYRRKTNMKKKSFKKRKQSKKRRQRK